jgi:hypothetical protein
MMESVAEVSGPFHSSQGGFCLLWGRWYKTSEDRRCGIFLNYALGEEAESCLVVGD